MARTPTLQNNTLYSAPLTGATVAIPSFNSAEMNVTIDPAGLLAALTITFPTTGLIDGQIINISSSQAVTTVTHTGGTILGALTTLAANGVARYAWSATGNKWFKLL